MHTVLFVIIFDPNQYRKELYITIIKEVQL
jgi:hypothetical protein